MLSKTVGVVCATLAVASPCYADDAVPLPLDAPLSIDFSNDPVLTLARSEADLEEFRAAVARAVLFSPATAEVAASIDEAAALIDEARENLGPTVDLSLQTYRVVARDFNQNQFDTIFERSRPLQRTDGIIQVEQNLIDFGSGRAGVRRARALARAADADAEVITEDLALRFIAAWSEVFGYRTLLGAVDAFMQSETDMRAAVQRRISEGAAAKVDIARVDALFADSAALRARFRRQLAAAEARYIAYAGGEPPAVLKRAPSADLSVIERSVYSFDSAVRAEMARAEAAREEAIAAEADTKPSLQLGLDAGRYGVFERDRDYDIRLRLTLRYRLFGGGGDPRATQSRARARAAAARADRIQIEANRDVAIALTDLGSLENQLVALEQSYRAARISRDATIARFIAARGDVFDVAQAERDFIGTATSYIQALVELDTTRYVLLARSGVLLQELNIDPLSTANAPEIYNGG